MSARHDRLDLESWAESVGVEGDLDKLTDDEIMARIRLVLEQRQAEQAARGGAR